MKAYKISRKSFRKKDQIFNVMSEICRIRLKSVQNNMKIVESPFNLLITSPKLLKKYANIFNNFQNCSKLSENSLQKNMKITYTQKKGCN